VLQFIDPIKFTSTACLMFPDETLPMVEDGWKLAIEAQDCLQALASATVSIPSVWQLPGGPSLKTDP